jgi:hypothetical protein
LIYRKSETSKKIIDMLYILLNLNKLDIKYILTKYSCLVFIK